MEKRPRQPKLRVKNVKKKKKLGCIIRAASDLVNAVAGGVDGAQQLQVVPGLAQSPQGLEDHLHRGVGSLHGQLLRRVAT